VPPALPEPATLPTASSVIDQDNCRFMTLAAGKSLFSIDYITDSDVGEMDGDFGLNQSNLCAEVAGQDVCTGEYFLTIQDAPVTSPEPSSLLLLGAGFVGLFGSLRRRMLWR
jgi:PEP-CTERM motif